MSLLTVYKTCFAKVKIGGIRIGKGNDAILGRQELFLFNEKVFQRKNPIAH